MNEANIFGTGLILGIIIACFMALWIATKLDNDNTSTMCRQLYSKTVNYETCMGKNFQDITKLIKPIDTEVEE